MKDFVAPPAAELRAPCDVMQLRRLGAMFPTRLSFLRVLTRALAQHGTPPQRHLWQMDTDGHGRAVYTLELFGRPYALVALSQDLAPEARSDRVIATAWDAAFVLYDGVPSTAEIDRIAAAAPLQEAGRFTEKDLVLSRANKSVRLWSHCVERLRSGAQPDPAFVNDVGYLMRTTAVYGNGKFGIADRALYAGRAGFEMSFMAEMLTVWLIRHFTHDLLEHVAGAGLEPDLKRHLGIGNATGLGMAPFLVTHPVLLNNWMMVRETALARVRAVPHLTVEHIASLQAHYERAGAHLEQWNVADVGAQAAIHALRKDWPGLSSHLADAALQAPYAMEALWQAGQRLSIETQELLLALMLEPFGDLVDGLAECLTDPFGAPNETFEDTDALRAALATQFDWALGIDYDDKTASAQFWYVSEEKREPRLGQRYQEPGAELESPLDIGRRIAALARDLPDDPEPLAAFLTRHPEHLLAVERVQIARAHPYSEVRGNLIDANCRPIDMLRSKLSLFGAAKFDPKSDLWTRVTLAQGAPLAEDLGEPTKQSWWCTVLAGC